MCGLLKIQFRLPAFAAGGVLVVHFLAWMGVPAPACSGVFELTSSPTDPIDRIIHAFGYDGTGGTITMGICIEPGSPFVTELQTPIENAITTFNQLEPTIGNVRRGDASRIPADALDFESILVSQVAHCLGLDYAYNSMRFTAARLGPDMGSTWYPGADGVAGSGDDLRGDDVNRHWFKIADNNPFTIAYPVDSTTYTVDSLLLPSPDTFAANANAYVAALYGFPNTVAVASPVSYVGGTRRKLCADDVATLMYAMSGIDELAGTADDYVFQLEYQGITDTCDILIQFDPNSNSISGFSMGLGSVMDLPDHWHGHWCKIRFGEEANWYFSTNTPCSESQSLVADQWRMISLPCDTGSNNTVQDVFGDDLNPADYGVRWGIFEYEELAHAYQLLDLSAPMNEGEGYWIKTLGPGQSMTAQGIMNEVIDVPLAAAASGRQNLVGHPLELDVCWADVRVVDGAGVLSLDEADPLIGSIRACAMVPPDPSCVMSRLAYKWNGAAYEPFDGTTPSMQGTMKPFDGLWVKAFKPGISLRIPAIMGVTSGADCTQCAIPPVADAGYDQLSCRGLSVTLGTPAQPGHTYSWSPGGETTARIDVSPLATTTYTVTATTGCGSAQDSVNVNVIDNDENLAGNFEGDDSGWTATGLWHRAGSSGCAAPSPGYASPIRAFYYGQDGTCDYDTGAANSGELTSPPIVGITADSTLSFQYLREAQESTWEDKTEVAVLSQSGLTTVLTIATNATTWTSSGPISLAEFAGETIRIRFLFDTFHPLLNDTIGWFIDDVAVVGTACLESKQNGAASPLGRSVPTSLPRNNPRNWSVRLTVESGDLHDSANVLGQLPGAADGYDHHDLAEPAPFSRRYLSIVFPHDDWGAYAGDYSSDFRAPDSPLGNAWRFDVIGAGFDQAVTLRWEAQGIPLRGWWLVDEETGERIRAEPGGSHTFTMTGSRRSFRWQKNE